MAAGHWVGFVAENGLNQTALGVVLYDDEGRLVGQKFRDIEVAIKRVDVPDTDFMRGYTVPVPKTWDVMKQRLDSTGNVMSVLKWVGGLPTLKWDEGTLEYLFSHEVLGRR